MAAPFRVWNCISNACGSVHTSILTSAPTSTLHRSFSVSANSFVSHAHAHAHARGHLRAPAASSSASSDVACTSVCGAISARALNGACGLSASYSHGCSSHSLGSSSSSSSFSCPSWSSPYFVPHRGLLVLRAKDDDEGGAKKAKTAKTAVKDDAQKRFAQQQLAHKGAILNRIRVREQRRKEREDKRNAEKGWHGKSLMDQVTHIDKMCHEDWIKNNPDKPPNMYPFKGAVGIRFYRSAWSVERSGSEKLRPFSVHSDNPSSKNDTLTVYSDFPHSYWTITRFKPKSAVSAKRRVWGVLTFKGRREASARKIPGANKKDMWRFLPPPYPAERAQQLIVYADDQQIPEIKVPTEEERKTLETPKPDSVLVQAPFTHRLPSKAFPKAVGCMIRRLVKARRIRDGTQHTTDNVTTQTTLSVGATDSAGTHTAKQSKVEATANV